MHYRRFGRTELNMPVITCGGMRYQYKWEDVPLAEVPADNQANLEACIHRAVELGINHIETARGYGSSERQLGCVLPELPRDELIVQTKICPEDDPDVFVKHFLESLDRLKLDYVDLFALHGINDDSVLTQAVRPGGCLAAARKLQADGLCRHVGFSTHGPLETILGAVTHDADGGFDYVNLHWFYIQQRHWPAVVEAARRDMGVFIISPVNKGGILNDPPQKLVDLCKPLHPIVFNDLYCLARREVHTLSIGPEKPSDFDLHTEAAALVDRAEELTAPIVKRLDAAYAAAIDEPLRNPWALNLPTFENTPGQLNLPTILWLRNLAVAFDLVEFGKMRYNLMGSAGHWFPGNNAAKAADVDLAPALKNCPVADRISDLLAEAHALLKADPVKRLSESESA